MERYSRTNALPITTPGYVLNPHPQHGIVLLPTAQSIELQIDSKGLVIWSRADTSLRVSATCTSIQGCYACTTGSIAMVLCRASAHTQRRYTCESGNGGILDCSVSGTQNHRAHRYSTAAVSDVCRFDGQKGSFTVAGKLAFVPSLHGRITDIADHTATQAQYTSEFASGFDMSSFGSILSDWSTIRIIIIVVIIIVLTPVIAPLIGPTIAALQTACRAIRPRAAVS